MSLNHYTRRFKCICKLMLVWLPSLKKFAYAIDEIRPPPPPRLPLVSSPTFLHSSPPPLQTSTPPLSCDPVPGFVAFANKDHPGDDIDYIDPRTSLQDIAAYCGSIKICASFRYWEGYGGWIKSQSVPMTDSGGGCFYVKQTGVCSLV